MNKVVITVRLSPAEAEALDGLAQSRGCSRSEAIRVALRAGAPLVKDGFSVNFTRFAEVLEQVGAGMSIVLKRDHPDHADTVEELAMERLELYHA